MKYLFIISILISSIQLKAQIKFNITPLSDETTYLVSLLSEETISTPLNRVSNLQVVVKSDIDNPLDMIAIESLIPGVEWSNSAFFDSPSSTDPYTLSIFSMVQLYTNEIALEANTEIPLFTMKRTDGDCIGLLTLPGKEDATVSRALNSKLNFTQSITVLGQTGNSFEGFINSEVNCQSLGTGTMEIDFDISIKAYPIPANEVLNVEWTNNHSTNDLYVEIFNNKGQLVQSTQLPATKGEHLTMIDLSAYSAGVYTLRMQTEDRLTKVKKFIVQK